MTSAAASGLSLGITVPLPPDVEERVKFIRALGSRVADFLRGQAELDDWRRRRYSERAHRFVHESRANLPTVAECVSYDELFRRCF